MAKQKPEARNLTNEEQGQWGIFLSHSSDAKETVEQLCRVFDAYGIKYLWDDQIKVGSNDFSADIISMIRKCSAAIIIVSEGALRSQWVNFELGFLNGLGKKIYMYDPRELMRDRAFRYHYDPECPGYADAEELARAVSAEKLFYSIFNNETRALSAELFRRQADRFLMPMHISLTVPGLSGVDPSTYQLRVLLIEFGSYTGCRYTDESICSQTGEDIMEDRCEVTGCKCCLNVEPDHNDYPECVLLNHVWDRVNVAGDTMELILPLHTKMGTTFKLFIDTPYGKTADALVQLFEEAGLKPGLAKGGEQNRVYFTLRNNRMHGLFDLEAEFSNNFICPGAQQL